MVARKQTKYLTRDLHAKIEQLEVRFKALEAAYIYLLDRQAREQAGLPIPENKPILGVMPCDRN
ncbi:MAG TPA: hypothetical protein VJ673_24495 [Aromatoleum sp.]|uniref:hypothetical protein n=1 Tax=Aromatoleum sp. TaxID=2307007 RepID=UPI002B48459B|nr:hypothetical protein [Aromatoleum sp.]HJV28858.1 hypothetical protein [Aromatoleum sp.]